MIGICYGNYLSAYESSYFYVGSGCPGTEQVLVNNECVDPSPTLSICNTGTFTNPSTGYCESTCPTNYLKDEDDSKCKLTCSSPRYSDSTSGFCIL